MSSICPQLCFGICRDLVQSSHIITKMSSQKLRFVKITKNAQTPTRGSLRAAGLDLYSARDATACYGKALIFTDLQIQLPDDCYRRIAPRSGLALKHHIDIGGGVIDQGLSR